MPLDHYVSQVHLKNFYSPKLGERMYAIKKSDLKMFQCSSKDVCRIEEGSTNGYLTDERAIETFLLDVEPKYNTALAKLRSATVDAECIYAIAGFAGYVGCCTPTAMRMHSEPLRAAVIAESALLDRQGLLPPSPPELGGKTLSELFAEGKVFPKIDPRFPQAMGISTVIGRTSLYGNSHWEILLPEENSEVYFTSDYPLAIERPPDRQWPNWIIPLAPDLAIRITPDIRLRGRKPDLTFSAFSSRQKRIGRQEILGLNRLIVQCAEEFVFYRDDQGWIENFVAKNRDFWISIVTERIPTGTGFMNISTQKIVRRTITE